MLQFHYGNEALGALSIGWPYMAFTGLENDLMIWNAYNGGVLNRIKIADDEEQAVICSTYITNTNDLFIVIQEDQKFKLFMIDLDECNMMEVDEEEEQDSLKDLNEKIQNLFRMNQRIFEYSKEDVGGASIIQLVVRGSSRKEMIDID